MDHVNAKIRAMRARLITPDQYRILCHSQSTEHFFAQLQTYPAYTHRRIAMSMSKEMDQMRLFLTGAGATVGTGLSTDKWMHMISLEEDHMLAWSYVKTLSNGPNRQALTYIKGMEIDMQNILRIYRLKQYYPEAEVYPHLIPICYKLNKEFLRQMVKSPGIAEFIVALHHTYYGHVFNSFEAPNRAVSQAMKLFYNRMTKRYPQSMAGVMSYFFDKKMESQNLTVVMEGIKYRLTPDEIFSRLKLY